MNVVDRIEVFFFLLVMLTTRIIYFLLVENCESASVQYVLNLQMAGADIASEVKTIAVKVEEASQ